MRAWLLSAVIVLAPSSVGGCATSNEEVNDFEENGCDALVDEDGDGFPQSNPAFACCDEASCSGLTDCNDQDENIHPDNFEGGGGGNVAEVEGDGIDSNCDGVEGAPTG